MGLLAIILFGFYWWLFVCTFVFYFLSVTLCIGKLLLRNFNLSIDSINIAKLAFLLLAVVVIDIDCKHQMRFPLECNRVTNCQIAP